jgi:hypothetical protein
MLIALTTQGERVAGRQGRRGEPYVCPACRDPVILKLGRRVIPHFAHRAGSFCANRGESPDHLALKDTLWTALREEPWVARCELEYPLGGDPTDIARRADLYVETGQGVRIAVEAQVSPVSQEAVDAKLRDYRTLGCRTMYVVSPRVLPGYTATAGLRALDGREVRVPAWVRALARQRDPWSEIPFAYVWEADELWLLAFDPVYRLKEWEGREDVEELVSTMRLHLVGPAVRRRGLVEYRLQPDDLVVDGVLPVGCSRLFAQAAYRTRYNMPDDILVALTDQARPLPPWYRPSAETRSDAEDLPETLVALAEELQLGEGPRDPARAQWAAYHAAGSAGMLATRRLQRVADPERERAEQLVYAEHLLHAACLEALAARAEPARLALVRRCEEQEEIEREERRVRRRRAGRGAPGIGPASRPPSAPECRRSPPFTLREEAGHPASPRAPAAPPPARQSDLFDL